MITDEQKVSKVRRSHSWLDHRSTIAERVGLHITIYLIVNKNYSRTNENEKAHTYKNVNNSPASRAIQSQVKT